MVKAEAARAANASLVKDRPLVGVFVGGTSGIGEYTVRTLAKTHGTKGAGLRLYIVGRNESKAEKTISDCKAICPKGDFRFLQATNISLLENVDKCSQELLQQERQIDGDAAHIDLLVMSTGELDFSGNRNETAEGLDVSASLLYYSRLRFITNLLPLLTSSPTHPSRIISVYAAGSETSGKFHPSDLSLREPGHYNFAANRAHVVHMKTMAFERLARQNAGRMSLVHVFPGLVVTPGFEFETNPWWFKLAWSVFKVPVKLFVATTAEDIGVKVLFLATDRFPARDQKVKVGGKEGVVGGVALATEGTQGGGAYSVSNDGETYDVDKHYKQLRKEGFEGKVWEHTIQAFAAIEAGKRFQG